MDGLEDRSLVDLVVRLGDDRAFSTLYDRHTPYLYRLALRLRAGDASEAANTVHDAWVAAAPRLAAFEWRSALRTWLAGFVLNVAKRQLPRQTLPLEASVDVEDRQPSVDAQVLAHIDIERMLESLPPGARHVLVLHDLEGWSHAQIAEQLGLDVGTSKSQLSRARGLLRAQWASPDHHGGD